MNEELLNEELFDRDNKELWDLTVEEAHKIKRKVKEEIDVLEDAVNRELRRIIVDINSSQDALILAREVFFSG